MWLVAPREHYSFAKMTSFSSGMPMPGNCRKTDTLSLWYPRLQHLQPSQTSSALDYIRMIRGWAQSHRQSETYILARGMSHWVRSWTLSNSLVFLWASVYLKLATNLPWWEGCAWPQRSDSERVLDRNDIRRYTYRYIHACIHVAGGGHKVASRSTQKAQEAHCWVD